MAKPKFTLTSTAFSANASIPSQYTCDGTQASPPLTIAGTPEGTQSFVLIFEDLDVPRQLKPDGVFLHWLVFNIPGSISEITENAQIGVLGANSLGKNAYASPYPPPEYEPSEHRYVFTLSALDKVLSLKIGASKDEVTSAMRGHVIRQTQLIGRYKRT